VGFYGFVSLLKWGVLDAKNVLPNVAGKNFNIEAAQFHLF